MKKLIIALLFLTGGIFVSCSGYDNQTDTTEETTTTGAPEDMETPEDMPENDEGMEPMDSVEMMPPDTFPKK